MLSIREFRIVLAGLAVAVLGLFLSFFTKTVYASGCRNGANCTYYLDDGGTGNGSCGTYTQGDICVCTYGGVSQNQSACGAPPA